MAYCQDEMKVVTEHTSARQEENETPGSKKIKNPIKAKASVGDSYKDFIDNNAKDAEEIEERPNNPSQEVEQVLRGAQQTPAAPEVSNRVKNRKNRCLKENNETTQDTTEEKDIATVRNEELETTPDEDQATPTTKAKMNYDDMDNGHINGSEALNVMGAHDKSADNWDTPDHPVNRKMTERNNEEEDIMTEETSRRSPGDKMTSKILKNGAMNKTLEVGTYDKPKNNDKTSENKDEGNFDHEKDIGFHDNSTQSEGNDEEQIVGDKMLTTHKPMCVRWILKEFLVLKDRIETLEDMELDQQEETKDVSRN